MVQTGGLDKAEGIMNSSKWQSVCTKHLASAKKNNVRKAYKILISGQSDVLQKVAGVGFPFFFLIIN